MRFSIPGSGLVEDDQAVFICASLPDQVERRYSFARVFGNKALFRFVDSVDGRNWSASEANCYISTALKSRWERESLKGGVWINPAAIACALSHRDKLLAEASKRDVVLCEDDVILQHDFIDLWSRFDVRSLFSKCDGVVLLHYTSSAPITVSGAPVFNFGRYQVFKLDDVHVASAACYYVNSVVASNIRQYQTPIRNCADEWVDMKRNGVFASVYILHPSPCRMAGMASNIGYGGRWKNNSVFFILARRLRLVIRRLIKHHYDSVVIHK